MKIVGWIVLAHAVLISMAYFLLRTDQAPEIVKPKPVEVAAPAAPEAPKGPTLEEFRVFAAERVREIPMGATLASNAQGATWPRPLSIDNAAKALNAIVEKAGSDPALIEEAATLSKACVLSVQYNDLIKSLCYLHLRKLSQKLGTEVSGRLVGRHIRDLANLLEE